MKILRICTAFSQSLPPFLPFVLFSFLEPFSGISFNGSVYTSPTLLPIYSIYNILDMECDFIKKNQEKSGCDSYWQNQKFPFKPNII
jgi:hypothetical protein